MRLDPESLDQVVDLGGTDLLQRLATTSEQNLRRRLAELRAALQSTPADLDAANRAAHSTKSSAAYIGALPMRDLALEIEMRSSVTEARRLWPGALEQVEALEAMLEDAMVALAAELARRRGS